MSRKNSVPVSAPVSAPVSEEAPVSVLEVAAPVSEAPAPAPAYRILGAGKDPLGFGGATVTGAIIAGIRSGEFTRKGLIESILDSYAGTDEAKRKATRTTISVTLSDLRRPIGTYHASRGLDIREEIGTGKLSFDPEALGAVEKAIAAGILSELRGKTETAKRSILTRFGLRAE